MVNVKIVAAKVAVSLVAVGSLVTVGTGVAGASTTAPASSHAATRERTCTHDRRYVAFATANQARFAAGTARFEALANKAAAAGEMSRAKHWDAVVGRRELALNRRKASLDARIHRDARLRSAADGSC